MRGQLFVMAAPSGAGKTTLTRMLLDAQPGILLSVSHTTRAPRKGELDGIAYHFKDVPTFERLRDQGEYLEWAHVHGNYYGTSKRWIEEQRAAGHDVLLEIDWQGARQVRAQFSDAVEIFILPPSVEALRQRLIARGTDSAEVIDRRVAAAKGEMEHVDEFDYVIINNDLARSLAELLAIVTAARLSLASQRSREPDLFAAIAAH